MFSKISRYRKLPDVVTTDVDGRSVPSKTLRLLPEVFGGFRHTVEEVDRLDHLACKFYKQPRKWWRICDANPEFLSPLALLGNEPLVTERFPLIFKGPCPPWVELLRKLSQQNGVLECWMDGERPLAKIRIALGDHRFRYAPPAAELAEAADFLDGGVVSQKLRDEFEDHEIPLSADVTVSRHDNRWLLVDEVDETEVAYIIDSEPRRLDVYECLVWHWVWSVVAKYNAMITDEEALKSLMEQLHFQVDTSARIGRIGKQIVIPPDVVM